jgi:hypothetical protein
MRKWILWIIVVSIIASIMTGCNGCNNSFNNLIGNGSFGGSGYSSAIGVLDTTFDSDGIVVHDNAAGGNSHDLGNSIYVDNTGKIYVTGTSYGSNADMVIWKYK